MAAALKYDITKDDLSRFAGRGAAFVTFGETMVRDTPADGERPERTRRVHLSMAGSEYTLAIGLARLGIPSSYITRVPDNPYGRMMRNIARENGVNTDHFVWAPKTEPIGRFIYEIGRTPRRDTGIYQRMFSAASRLDAGMVDWQTALKDCRLFHTSGITFGLAAHSGYERNYLLAAFEEAMAHKPAGCWVGMDFNYRATLWSPEQARAVLTPLITDHVDVLVTTIEDMAQLYGMGCGQYSARQIDDGDIGPIEDDDIRAFAAEVCARFATKIVAITIRYPDSFEQHRWESAAADADGNFFRSPAVKPITLWDRLGGGDTWNAGFYYGLLTAGFNADGLEKGVLVGDAATRLKQTLLFDLPIIEKAEIQALMKADVAGGGKRTAR
ncbi:MAG TPA: sugar kinase [Anaerolineae bacterium]|mgnify:FL=1|nr:sugar kinase [Anaerolineae bacterium]HQK15289.1 sugar kinase [Anaerolineae bacterium]